jgi:AcrR family transcriptional regulator
MSSYTTTQNQNLQKASESKILNAANKLFIKRGYFNVNIAKIAREAGVSPPYIYNYFQGKDDILKRLIENHFNTTSRLNKKLSGREMIKDYIDNSVECLEKHCGFLKVVYPMVFFTESFGYIKELLHEVTMKQVKELTTAFEEVGVKHPLGEAALLVTEIDGMNLHYMTIKEKYQLNLFRDILYHRYHLA